MIQPLGGNGSTNDGDQYQRGERPWPPFTNDHARFAVKRSPNLPLNAEPSVAPLDQSQGRLSRARLRPLVEAEALRAASLSGS